MTDKEIIYQMRALDLDMNKLTQEYYHQKPKEVTETIWAIHSLHQIGKKILNAAALINQDPMENKT